MKKPLSKHPFTVTKDLSGYKGTLSLFTHTVLTVKLGELTYIGLGKRGTEIRSALRKRGILNMRAGLVADDPNKEAEARREAATFHKEAKERHGQLLNHQPLYGMKDGNGVILKGEGKYVTLQQVDDRLQVSIKVHQQRSVSGDGQDLPETWLVAQVSGVSYDIVARPGSPILIGEIKENGASDFAEIQVDDLYKVPVKTAPFNAPRIVHK